MLHSRIRQSIFSIVSRKRRRLLLLWSFRNIYTSYAAFNVHLEISQGNFLTLTRLRLCALNNFDKSIGLHRTTIIISDHTSTQLMYLTRKSSVLYNEFGKVTAVSRRRSATLEKKRFHHIPLRHTKWAVHPRFVVAIVSTVWLMKRAEMMNNWDRLSDPTICLTVQRVWNKCRLSAAKWNLRDCEETSCSYGVSRITF